VEHASECTLMPAGNTRFGGSAGLRVEQFNDAVRGAEDTLARGRHD
jgi:hypothetical protein